MEKSEKGKTDILPYIVVWRHDKLEYLEINDNLIDIIESGKDWRAYVLTGVCSGCGDKLKTLCLVENKSEQELDELAKRLEMPHGWLNEIHDNLQNKYEGEIVAETDELRNFVGLKRLRGKKICIQPIFSNDEVGDNSLIVIMDLQDKNDIADVLRKTLKERIKKSQNKLVSMLYDIKNNQLGELKDDIVEDLKTLDWLLKEEENQAIPVNIDKKAKAFFLSIRPDSKIELRRIDTDENIDIKNIYDLFEVFKDDKYDFIY